MGIEPTLPAWEAGVLPIYDTCLFTYNCLPYLTKIIIPDLIWYFK